MPREKLIDSVNDTFELVVAWGRDAQYLQVATEVADWQSRPGAFYDPVVPDLNTTTTTAPSPNITWLATPPGMSPVAKQGWYVNLNRYQVNELIRILRRARDQAFGRDE